MERDMDWELFEYNFMMLPKHRRYLYCLKIRVAAVKPLRLAFVINAVIIIGLTILAIAVKDPVVTWVAGIVSGLIVGGTVVFWLLHDLFNSNK